MSDLDKLIEAVEAGKIWLKDSRKWRSVGINGFAATEAFYGSLDAALQLHEALLLGWHVAEISEAAFALDHVGKNCLAALAERAGKGLAEANGPNMARAWLLAILKALRAQAAP